MIAIALKVKYSYSIATVLNTGQTLWGDSKELKLLHKHTTKLAWVWYNSVSLTLLENQSHMAMKGLSV